MDYQDLFRMAMGKPQTYSPMNEQTDSKKFIDGLITGQNPWAQAVPTSAQVVAELDGSGTPTQQLPPTVPANDVNATIENGAQTEAQTNGQIQQAASELQTAQKAQDSPNATPQYTLRTDLLDVMSPEYATNPTERALYEAFQKDRQEKLDASLLPVKLAIYDANNAAIQRAYPDTVMGIQRDLVRQLAAAKQQYDVSKAAGDENGMALAHQAADVVRQQAASIGLNLDQFGGNEDTAAMAQALANNDARAMQSLIGGDVTPEQYYQQIYNDARDHGASKRIAEQYAQEQTEKYQADRYARMQQAFFTYGLTDRGSINPFGVQLFGKMMQDNPETVGLYAKMFGLPVDDYKLGNQVQLLGEQNKNTMQQNEQKHGFSMEEIGLRGTIEAKIHQLDGEIKAALSEQDFEHAKYLQNQKIAAQTYLAAIKGGGSSSGGGSRSSSGSGNGWKVSDAKNVIELYNKWNEDHPDEPESANPYADGYEEALTVVNNNNPMDVDPDDYNSVRHFAQNVVEQNFRDGYTYTPEDLYQMISSIGGYGPQVAAEMGGKKQLVAYGKKQ